ncbi:hypothetical protein Q8F55_000721 [Vanrija albida]|uniref:Uncharacterized protein n=1 Tax=Vanrija albida TaxID=181172 RepID=A0ABR3QEP2_9TREE
MPTAPAPAATSPRRKPTPLSLQASTHAPFDDLRPPSLVSDRTSTASSSTSPRLSLALPSPFPLCPFPPRFEAFATDVLGDDESARGIPHSPYALQPHSRWLGVPPSPVLLRSGFAGARAVPHSVEEKPRRRQKHQSVVPVKGVTTPHGTPRAERFPDLHRPLPPLPRGLGLAPGPRSPREAAPRSPRERPRKSRAKEEGLTRPTPPRDPGPAPEPPLPPTPVTPHAPVALSPEPERRARPGANPARPQWLARVHRACRPGRFRHLRRRWRLVWRADE